MKFIVSRTSGYDIKPCEEAVKVELTSKEYGHPINCWVIEINSLEDLLKFKKECGHDLIIGDSYYKEIPFEIEIYDYYRE